MFRRPLWKFITNTMGGGATEDIVTLTTSILHETGEGVNYGNLPIVDMDLAQAGSASVWTKNTDTTCTLIGMKQTTGSANGWSMRTFSNKFRTTINGQGGFTTKDSTINVTTGTWVNLTFTWDGVDAAGLLLYVNGSPVSTTTVSDTLATAGSNDADFRTGSRSDGGDGLVGNLAQTVVFDRVLTAGEVTELYNGGYLMDVRTHSAFANCTHYAPHGGAPNDSTTNVQDLSGNSNHGTPTSWEQANFDAGDVPSPFRSLSFGGTDEYISIPDDSTLDITSNISISAWFKSSGTSAGIFAKFTASGNQRSFYCNIEGSGKVGSVFYKDGAGAEYSYYNTNSTYNDNAWHHLAITYNSSNVHTIYIDGSSVATTDNSAGTPDGTIFSGTSIASIGSLGSASTFMVGNVTEVAVWDTAVLSAAEVAAIYNSGVPIDVTANSGDYTSSGDLVSYWPINASDNPTTSDGILDAAGSNNGTGQNMEADDLAESYPS